MMTDFRPAFLLVPVAILGSCGSAPPAPDEAIEERFVDSQRERDEWKRRQDAFQNVLQETDTVIERYTLARLDSGSPKSDKLAERLGKHLTMRVQDHFEHFVRAAADASIPRNQAIALAALGFSADPSALDPLLNGLASPDPNIVGNAVYGIGLLADRRTPPMYLKRVVDNASYSNNTRSCAAWSILQVQDATTERDAFAPIWRAILDEPIEVGVPAVIVSALRGLGQFADESDAPRVERYLVHATPQVRQAAAVAVGRIGAVSSHEALLDLISPAESVPNVRLAARKALQALAGGVDRGYDVKEWQRVFERG